jgi:hypothetical protein
LKVQVRLCMGGQGVVVGALDWLNI